MKSSWKESGRTGTIWNLEQMLSVLTLTSKRNNEMKAALDCRLMNDGNNSLYGCWTVKQFLLLHKSDASCLCVLFYLTWCLCKKIICIISTFQMWKISVSIHKIQCEIHILDKIKTMSSESFCPLKMELLRIASNHPLQILFSTAATCSQITTEKPSA